MGGFQNLERFCCVFDHLFHAAGLEQRNLDLIEAGLVIGLCRRQIADIAIDDIKHHHGMARSEEHTSELQSHSELVCRPLLEKQRNTSLSAATITLRPQLDGQPMADATVHSSP